MSNFQNVMPESYCFSVEQFLLRHSPLVIPQWQRGYSWKSEHITDFLDDINDFFSENKEKDFKKATFYLLGQIITVQNERDEFEIVDGQQRITTMYLLLISLYRSLSKFPSNGETLNFIRGLIQLRISTQTSGRIHLNLKSLYQDGSKILESLMKQGLEDFEQIGQLTISQENIKEAYGIIDDWVTKNFDNEVDLVNFSNLFLYNVMFARLEISTIKAAIDTFEKMNNRGVELQDSDLLKNYLFKNIEDDQYKKLTENWKSLTQNITSINPKQKSLRSEGTFIKYLGISESGTKINNTKQLFEYFEDKYKSKEELLEYSVKLPEKSQFYKEICNFYKHPSQENYNHSLLFASKYLRAVQTIPALLAARRLKNYNTVAELIDSRFSIYILSKERTQDFETLIPRLVSTINNELTDDSTPEEIIEKFNHTLGFVYLEMESQLKNGIKSLTYQKKSNHIKLRFILAKVNKYLDEKAKYGDCNKTLDEYMKTKTRTNPLDGIDLDHILAQQYLSEFEDENLKVMNEIGALTFVHASEHQDGPQIADAYPKDKAGLYSQSRYVLTKSLVSQHEVTPRLKQVIDEIQIEVPSDLENWGPKIVNGRTEFIIKTFIQILRNHNIQIPQSNLN